MTPAQLAALHADLTCCRDRLQDVHDAMPGHMEQQQQAVLDGVRGADAALLWLGAEGKRLAAIETRRAPRRARTPIGRGPATPFLEIRLEKLELRVSELRVRDLHICIERVN